MPRLRTAALEIASGLPVGDPTRRKILAALKQARARGNEFDYEGSDFGVQAYRSHGGENNVILYWPLENIGRRGRRVTVFDVSIRSDRIAWAHTYLDRVKKVSNARQALALLEKTLDEAEAGGADIRGPIRDERKGVDKSLPTPTIYKIEDIKGFDIKVHLNGKPIEVSSEKDSKRWMDQRMTYWFRIHQRFQKKLHLLRGEFAAAQGLDAVGKILKRERIPFDYHTYMMPGWD